MTSPAPHPKTPLGLELVIVYKTVKGALEALAAVLVAFGAALGLATHIQDAIARLAAHLTREWSLEIAERLFHEATTSHLRLAAVLLIFDAILTSAEGWGLERRKRWAPWLVVVATGFFIPFEAWALVHRASPLRAGTLAVNAAIVAYLARTIWIEHGRKHPRALPAAVERSAGGPAPPDERSTTDPPAGRP